MGINTYQYATKDDLDRISDRLSDALLLFSKEFGLYNANQKHILNNLERLTYELQESMKENRHDFMKLKDDMKNIPLIDIDVKNTKNEVNVLKINLYHYLAQKNLLELKVC